MAVLPIIALFLANTCPPLESIFPCSCTGKNGPEVNCEQLNTQIAFESALKPLVGYSLVKLTISRTNASTLPTDIFKDLHVERLILEKFEVDDASFRPGKRHFQGLENSLKTLEITKSFRNGHRPLINFQLDHLTKLNVVILEDNQVPEVQNDWFKAGPTGLTNLIFENNGIEEIGNRAFQSLVNLELLVVARNHLREITRSMFPQPALKLRTLDLERNKLRDIPRDMFADMPSLTDVNLSYNLIHTLQEEVFSSYLSRFTELSLKGNALKCDEKLRWVCKVQGSVTGICVTPAAYNRKTVDEFCGL